MDATATILFGVFLIIANGWIVYWIQYNKKSGENEAMKDDIQTLTTLVEDVKKDFNSDLEKLKSNLSLFTNQRFSLSTEERNSIFKYFDAYSKWLFTISHLNMQTYNDDSYTKWSDDAANAECDTDVAESRVQIFVATPEFMSLKKDIHSLTFNVKMITINCFFEVRKVELEAERHQKNEHTKHDIEEYGKIIHKKVVLFQEMNTKHHEVLDKLYPKLQDMRELLKQHLLDMLKNED